MDEKRPTPNDPAPAVLLPLPTAFEYAVKFICGRSAGEVVAPGHYYTAINVHNPARETVVVRWKVAVALPGAEAGPVSGFSKAELRYDEAMEIDCADIRCLSHRRDPFLKGFVVIHTDRVDVDVVAVYTAAGADQHVETLHTERVRPRARQTTQPGLPDLLPIPHPQHGFCNRDPQGGLIVTVRNQGTANAPPSDTRVDFAPGGSVTIPTPAILAGQQVDLPAVKIPGECFNRDCNFRITVDVNNVVGESDEGNNTASGTCAG